MGISTSLLGRVKVLSSEIYAKNPITHNTAKYVHFIKNFSKCHFLESVQFCESSRECLGIPLNHRWSWLIAPTHFSNTCYVMWFRLKRKLIFTPFLDMNGENFDLSPISKLS